MKFNRPLIIVVALFVALSALATWYALRSQDEQITTTIELSDEPFESQPASGFESEQCDFGVTQEAPAEPDGADDSEEQVSKIIKP